jgi:hypothetical protein
VGRAARERIPAIVADAERTFDEEALWLPILGRGRRLRASDHPLWRRLRPWLERARRFAVHALGQVGRSEQRCSGRCTLWTGDIGAALFAADCLEPRLATPIVEYL